MEPLGKFSIVKRKQGSRKLFQIELFETEEKEF